MNNGNITHTLRRNLGRTGDTGTSDGMTATVPLLNVVLWCGKVVICRTIFEKTCMSVLLDVGPKCTLAMSHAAPGESR